MRTPLILVIAVTMTWQAAAQISTVEDYLKWTSIDPRTVSEADCTAQIAKANALNSADLFRASSICQAVRKAPEGNFLLSAGQARAMADMALLAPAAKADLEAAAALYGFIFYHAGGPGDEEVLRDAVARYRFNRLFDGWAPTYSAAYSPGWNVGKRPDESTYRQVLSESKADRKRQLVDISRLYSDDQYYALHRQFADLQKRNSGSFVEGTPDNELASNLQQRMSQRAQTLGVDQGPSDGDPKRTSTTPPSLPGQDETIVSSSSDPVAKQCTDWAEHLALMSVSKVVRVVMTTGSEWGMVWRADIANSDQPPQMSRFICSQYGTMLESRDGQQSLSLP
jgi:hypothetical protein